MTDQEWLAAEDPSEMLEYLDDAVQHWRKFSLFAVACCHRIGWSGDLPPGWGNYLRFLLDSLDADPGRSLTDDEIMTYLRRCPVEREQMNDVWSWQVEWAVKVSRSLTSVGLALAQGTANSCSGVVGAASNASVQHLQSEMRAQCQLIRDIFGNPFRPGSLNSAWLTWHDGTVLKLAQTIYDDKRFGIMPILADALHEAGCTNDDILKHCRESGEHVRGCWVVDLILGKA